MGGRPMKKLGGAVFGRLLVANSFRRGPNRHIVWLCTCVCGGQNWVSANALSSGRTRSCGCLYLESIIRNGHASVTHGMGRTPEYWAWLHMRYRCCNPDCEAYEDYGARGIKVCARWLESFENFFADMGLKPSGDLSLDRIDNDGGYEPANCRWATAVEQNNNTRRNHVRSGECQR